MPNGIAALIVDDEEVNLIVAQEILRSVSAEADLAGGGAKALEMCRLRRYDIIFLDHLMPGMDGLETAKRLRAITDAPIVALSSNEDPGAQALFLQNGFAAFLPKPLDTERLSETLARLLPAKRLQQIKPETTGFATLPMLASELGLDTARALGKMGGNETAYLSVLRVFAQSGVSKLQKIKEFLAAQDWEHFRISIHGQKGALANIGATALSEEARAMEMAAKNGAYSLIGAAFEAFCPRYTSLCQRLSVLWPEENSPDRDAAEKDRGQVPAVLQSVERCLAQLEQEEALEALAPLLRVRFEEPLAAALSELRAAIEGYDYDGASEVINRMSKGANT